MTPQTATAQAKARLGFHFGNILRLISGRYPRLAEVIREIVANMIDSNARWGLINIDLKKRRLAAYDNGDGVTIEKFETVLIEIGKSQKLGVRRRSGKRSIGEFGLALISPLFKCATYRFISRPANRRSGFNEWTFESEALRTASTIAEIPRTERPDLDRGSVGWNTLTLMEQLAREPSVLHLTLEEIAAEILDFHGKAIREDGIDLEIRFTDARGFEHPPLKIIPPEYEGVKLPVATYRQPESGTVTLALYQRPVRAPIAKLRLSLSCGDSDFQIPWRTFALTHTELLDAEARTVFDSGLFEGTITVERCQLLPERKGFVEDNALLGLFLALGTWCREVGIELLDADREFRKGERFQHAGLKAIEVLREFIAQSTCFADVIAKLRGTIGPDHTEVPGGKPLSGHFKGLGTYTPPGRNPTPRPHARPSRELPNRPHFAVGGPRGHRRVSVKSQFGLVLIFEPFLESRKRFAYSEKTGQVQVNILHPDFSACQDKDRTLTQYTTLILTWVLTLLAQSETNRDFLRHAEDTLFQAQVWQILHAGGITGYRPGRKTKTNADS